MKQQGKIFSPLALPPLYKQIQKLHNYSTKRLICIALCTKINSRYHIEHINTAIFRVVVFGEMNKPKKHMAADFFVFVFVLFCHNHNTLNYKETK